MSGLNQPCTERLFGGYGISEISVTRTSCNFRSGVTVIIQIDWRQFTGRESTRDGARFEELEETNKMVVLKLLCYLRLLRYHFCHVLLDPLPRVPRPPPLSINTSWLPPFNLNDKCDPRSKITGRAKSRKCRKFRTRRKAR